MVCGTLCCAASLGLCVSRRIPAWALRESGAGGLGAGVSAVAASLMLARLEGGTALRVDPMMKCLSHGTRTRHTLLGGVL